MDIQEWNGFSEIEKSRRICRHIASNDKISFAEELLGGVTIKKPLASDFNSLPPILQSSFEQSLTERDYISIFETLSLSMRSTKFTFNHPKNENPPAWLAELDPKTNEPVLVAGCKSKTILDACVRATEDIGDPFFGSEGAASLKLVGLTIDGDLDLSKLNLPFSVRLICCHIKGALILDRSQIMTLDLSGSIIDHGVSANYVTLHGALRARRMVCCGPCDFGGATVSGSVDLTDAILYSENAPSARASYVADRGVLNFSLGTLKKDVRFTRSRVYGGLNLRGCRIRGMLHFNDAVLRSPIAHFELLLDNAVQKIADERVDQSFRSDHASKAARASMDANDDLAAILHSKRIGDRNFAKAVETLGRYHLLEKIWPSKGKPELFRLLEESRRLAESALRAEGMRVGGPVYANAMRVCGRLRMKSIVTGGGVSFNGSRFRTVRSLRRDIASRCEDLRKIKDVWEAEASPRAAEILKSLLDAQEEVSMGLQVEAYAFRKEYAVDLRDAEIGGPLDFGHDGRDDEERVPKSCDKLLKERIALQLYKTGEDITKFISVFTSTKLGRGSQHRTKDDQDLNDQFLELAKGQEDPNTANFDNGSDPLHYLFEHQVSVADENIKTAKTELAEARNTEVETRVSNPREIKRLERRVIERRIERVKRLAEFPLSRKKQDLNWSRKEDLPDLMSEIAMECGTLNATLLIGEIRLINARIKGSLIFSSLIANVIDDIEEDPGDEHEEPARLSKTDRRLINMRNIRIEGDLDLSNSIGVSSINAKQAQLVGSIKFCDKPRFCEVEHRYKALTGRAFFPRTENVRNTLHFERARIGRNAAFLFDRDRGPSLYLASAEVGENLLILPAKSGLQLPEGEIEERFNPAKRNGEINGAIYRPRLQSFLWSIGLGGAFKSELNQNLLDTMDSTIQRPPRIDLRGTRTRELTHPPSAWPKHDGLLITGLRYERTHTLGPLVPVWWAWPRAFVNFHNHQKSTMQHMALWLTLLVGTALFCTLFGLLATGSDHTKDIQNDFGGVNLLGTVFLATLGLMHLITRAGSRNRSKLATRLATLWLGLQRRHFNTSRIMSESRPYEPYLRAASALRSAGYGDAADEVEMDRLRARTNDLSWRFAPVPKFFLKALDGFIGYGFKPVKALSFGAVFLLASSIIFHQAERNCAILPAKSADCTTASVYFADKNETRPNGAFNSMWYTINMFVPLSPIEKETDWVLAERAEDGGVQLWYHAILMLRLLGWLLISLIVFAIAARIETLFARSRLPN